MNTRFSNTRFELSRFFHGSSSRIVFVFVHTHMDVVRVRAVCKSCRSSVSPPVISLKLPFSSKSLEYLPLVKRTIYKIQACEQNPNPWTLFGSAASNGAFLLQVEEEEGAQGMRLLTPLSGYPYPVEPPTDPKGLNFLTSRLSQICTYYYYKSSTPFLHRFALRKVVVSCSNPVTANDYAVMAVDYGQDMFEDVDGILYFYKSGENEWGWMVGTPDKYYLSYVDGTHGLSFNDLISYKGKFYAIQPRGSTIVIDPYSKLVSHVAPDIWPCSNCAKQIHLVESLGHLLLVNRDPSDWNNDDNAEMGSTYVDTSDWNNDDNAEMGSTYVDNFNVYKLDEEEGKWVEIESLGDQALFVSNSVSFSVSARDYAGYKENCIYYYSDRQCHPYWDDRDIRVMFSLEDGHSQPLQQGDVFF